MRVFVKNKRGESLMPCSNRKARILLKENKATIVSYQPFTIQLTYATGEVVQDTIVAVDTGAKNIGIAVVSNHNVLAKMTIELRQDIKKNITARKILRRNRRYRKMRYRKARFLNRKRSANWLPPSLESRVQNTFFWIDKIKALLPNPKLIIEVGKFDPQKMINPNIIGKEYQQGPAQDFSDIREYVFARDNHTCQICKKREGVLVQHHIIPRSQNGSNAADNLVTLCKECHEKFHAHKINHKFPKPREMKEPPFMNSLRRRIFTKYPEASITYGSITKPHRMKLGLRKSHVNDAIAISGIQDIKENPKGHLKIKQFRNKKRSLHEATARRGRKVKNTTQARNCKNIKSVGTWRRGDKVIFENQKGFITGFTGNYCYLKDIDGNYITQANKAGKQIKLKEIARSCHNHNWLSEFCSDD